MNREMTKIVYAVLRVFLDAYNRGQESALHAKEITEQVCKQLQRRKEKEKKNTHGYVVAALKALKTNQIIFEAVDDWGNDKLRFFKPVEGKKIYALTADAVEFLTRGDFMLGYAAGSQRVLNAVLAEFGVIRPETEPTVVPAVLVETVSSIQHKAAAAAYSSQEAITPMTATTTPQAANNNVQRLVAEIRNAARTAHNTPGQLLGALRAAKANSPAAAVSFADVLFNPTKGARVREVLTARGLLAHREQREINFKTKPRTPQFIGMYLTPLGQQVAESGDFVDDRPSEERYVRPTQSKYGKMVRSRSPRGGTGARGNTVGVASAASELAALRAEIAELRAALPSLAAANTDDCGTETIAARHEVKMGERYRTIAGIVAPVVAAVVERLTALQTENGAEQLNIDAAALAMVEIDQVIAGFKCYLYSCARGEREFDASFLQDYVAQVELEAEQLENERRLSVLGTPAETGTARVLRGSKAIKRVVWAAS